MKTLKNNKGFTLVEMVAVMIILGILAIVVVPRIIDFPEHVSDGVSSYEETAQTKKDVYDKYLGIEKEKEKE